MTKLERIILNTQPVSYIVRETKRTILPGFEGVPLYDVIRFFFKQIKRVGLNERAAAISFNFIMAIPAVCICIFTLVPYMPVSKQVTAELLSLTRSITPNQNTYNFVNTFLQDFLNTPRGGLLSFGFLLVIFYASNAMMTVLNTFDKSIYQYQRKANFLKKRWKAIRMTIVMFGLILGVLLLIIGQGWLFDKIMNLLNIKGSDVLVVKFVRLIITLGIFFYGISYIYKYGANVKKRWSTFSPGSILATFLIIVTTYLFSYWVDNFSSFNKIYGSIGTVLVLMLFIYLNSFILLIGFELNVSITYLKTARDEAELKKLHTLKNKEVFK